MRIFKSIKNLILCVILCATSFIAIGYATLSIDLNIDGNGTVYPYSNVHITEANPLTSTDGAYVLPNRYGSLFFDSTTYLSSSPSSEAKTDITIFNNSNDVVLNQTKITVYKQTILCDENGYWSPSTTLVGSAPVIDYEYHNNTSEHAVDITKWEPILSMLE